MLFGGSLRAPFFAQGYVIHPNYTGYSDSGLDPVSNDLAVLLLDAPSGKQPAVLAESDPAPGTVVTVAGWGLNAAMQLPSQLWCVARSQGARPLCVACGALEGAALVAFLASPGRWAAAVRAPGSPALSCCGAVPAFLPCRYTTMQVKPDATCVDIMLNSQPPDRSFVSNSTLCLMSCECCRPPAPLAPPHQRGRPVHEKLLPPRRGK